MPAPSSHASLIARVVAADLAGLASIESLGSTQTVEETEHAYAALNLSVEEEQSAIEELELQRQSGDPELLKNLEILYSDLEWKSRVLEELSHNLPDGWAHAARAIWSQRPWLSELKR